MAPDNAFKAQFCGGQGLSAFQVATVEQDFGYNLPACAWDARLVDDCGRYRQGKFLPSEDLKPAPSTSQRRADAQILSSVSRPIELRRLVANSK